jgi:hypothetical protein
MAKYKNQEEYLENYLADLWKNYKHGKLLTKSAAEIADGKKIKTILDNLFT